MNDLVMIWTANDKKKPDSIDHLDWVSKSSVLGDDFIFFFMKIDYIWHDERPYVHLHWPA